MCSSPIYFSKITHEVTGLNLSPYLSPPQRENSYTVNPFTQGVLPGMRLKDSLPLLLERPRSGSAHRPQREPIAEQEGGAATRVGGI